MLCPKCQANVANDSNFCPRCGTPFGKPDGFVAKLWRDNKPGFLILALLLVAMLGSIGYYLYSRTGKFVVTIESVSKDEAIGIYAKAAMESYCREFGADCRAGESVKIEENIRKVIPTLFRDNAGGFARITYRNDTGQQVTATRFKYRQPPGSWREGNVKNFYQPKIDRLRAAFRRTGDMPFEHKVDLAATIAAVEHSVPFTLKPGDSKVWCLVNETADRERQIEYALNGKTYQTAVLR